MGQADFYAKVQEAIRRMVLEARPDQRQTLLRIRFVIQAGPDRSQLQGVRPGSVLAGQYDGDQDPPTITLFRSTIEYLGVPVEDVVRHEAAHALGFPGLDDIRYACGVAQGPLGALRGDRPQLGKNCPVCILDESLAYSAYLMRRLAEEASLQGRIPNGLGGTIPLAAQALQRACGQLPKVARLMPDRLGEMRSLQSCLARAAGLLTGWLDTVAVKAAADQLQLCSRAAYKLAWAYYSRGQGPVPRPAGPAANG